MTMREILFRGKCDGGCAWIFGYYIGPVVLDGSHEICDIDVPSGIRYDIDPETLGQYAEKDDKNGTAIFEGDLVQAVLPRSRAQNGFVWPLMPVVFRDGIFGLLTARDEVVPFTAFAPAVTLEVKGNIHDHPEMLKGEKANEG